MKELSIVAPIKKSEDIAVFVENSKCRTFYVYHHKFLNNNFEYINEFIERAHKNGAEIYVNFKHNISEESLSEIKKFIKYLRTTDIDGIFINSYAILEAIKLENLPFKIIIDSYFDIHNLSGIDFAKMFHKVNNLIITEEIYLKNIAKIKKYTDLSLAIDTDNLPWCIEDIKKSKSIDTVVIKGDFETSDAILEGINLIENIIAKPKMFKNQKLPFKHVRKGVYQTNHFSGEITSTIGADFKFSRNIQKHEWECKSSRLMKDFDYKSLTSSKLPKINLRLSSLDHINQLKKYIRKLGFNPVYSIEYGEILSTVDLAKRSFNEILDYVKKFCAEYGIYLNLSTPKILIERDFDRVYEYVKNSCLEAPHPTTIICNNIGYFWAFINDDELHRFPIEIGYGINLLNSMSISCLYNLHPIDAVDFTVFDNVEYIRKTVKKIKNIVPRRKLTIAGNVRIPSLGLCPLNNDTAIISRLECKAPCHKGNFALKDPSLNKVYPFVVDGFCKMHMYKDKIMHLYNYVDLFAEYGINEFVIDLSSLSAKFLPVLLTNFLNSRAGLWKYDDAECDEYMLNQMENGKWKVEN